MSINYKVEITNPLLKENIELFVEEVRKLYPNSEMTYKEEKDFYCSDITIQYLIINNDVYPENFIDSIDKIIEHTDSGRILESYFDIIITSEFKVIENKNRNEFQ